ncbi:MAG: FHA domain-containing protein [Solirubrobacteraceae bacterium]|nr:FHA domain-containing protein [Solirubrobacteraceae bacterium]
MQRHRSETASAASGTQLLIELERHGLPILHRTCADGRVEAFVLEATDDGLTVGRAPACDLVIDDDPGVSRVHLELVRLGDGWVAEDRGLSRNGTLIDSEPLGGRRRLVDACRLTVGATVLEYRAPAEPTASPPTVTAIGRTAPAITAGQRTVLVEFVRPILGGGASPAGNAEIAGALVLSPETVKSHLKDLYVRFGLDDVAPGRKRAELAQAAIALGVVSRADTAPRPA